MSGVRVLDGMPEADYHAHPALSCSGAKLLLSPSTPAHYRWRMDHGEQTTRTFDVGRAAHALALGAGADIVTVPDELTASNGAWSTAAAKAYITEQRDAGRTVLKAADLDTVEGMAAALKADPLTGRLFDHAQGRAEVSVFWTDDEFGVERRARFDWLPDDVDGRPLIVQDYKTAETADPVSFGRGAASKYRYFQQHPWYCDAVEAAYGLRPAFVFVVQEKEPPYLPSVVQLVDDAVDLGRALNRQALEVFRDCTDAGVWPGYSSEVELVDVARWVYQ